MKTIASQHSEQNRPIAFEELEKPNSVGRFSPTFTRYVGLRTCLRSDCDAVIGCAARNPHLHA